MQLKKYQTRTLKILSDFLTDTKIIGNDLVASDYKRGGDLEGVLRHLICA